MVEIQRDQSADLLKGFAIIVLVASHVLQFSAADIGVNYVQSGCSGLVELWARSFNMPLFFFVSGLLLGLKPKPIRGLVPARQYCIKCVLCYCRV